MKSTVTLLAALVLCLITGLLLQAEPQAEPSKEQIEALVSSLKWQTGTVDIKNGLAKINLTDDFRFLGAADAQKVLHDVWNNPPDSTVLGMIFPKDQGPLDREGWAITVSYEEGGYVKDDDAEKINYTDMLKQMQKDILDSNPEREKEGYSSAQLVGWASPPRYDKATHKLYWAKDLKFGDNKLDTLNYDIRILGRRGVLVLGAIASMNSFEQIDKKIPEVLGMVDFQAGNSYADFDPKVDKVAEYGLAALVAGGALAGAAKLGFFGALFKYIVVAVLALKKAIIFVIIAIVAGAKKLWSKFSGKSSNDHLNPP